MVAEGYVNFATQLNDYMLAYALRKYRGARRGFNPVGLFHSQCSSFLYDIRHSRQDAPYVCRIPLAHTAGHQSTLIADETPNGVPLRSDTFHNLAIVIHGMFRKADSEEKRTRLKMSMNA